MIETFTIVSGLVALLSVLQRLRYSSVLFWSFVLLFTAFYGLRWEMGTDWANYFTAFENANLRSTSGFEPGFMLYTTLLRSITDNYSVYLVITTAITFVGIYYPIFRLTKSSWMSVFYLTGTLPWYAGTLRQMIACVCFTFALIAALKRRPVLFAFLIVVGASFHTTALLFLPMYLVVGLTWTQFAFVFVALCVLTVAARNLIALLDLIVASVGFEKSFASRTGGGLEFSDPMFGFLRKALTIGGLGAFAAVAKTSPKTDAGVETQVRFTMMMVSLSIILYYLGTYSINYASSRLDIYVSIIAGAALIGFLDTTMTSRSNRLLLLAFVISLVAVFYSRLEYMDLFHPYSSVFYNRDLGRNLY